MSENQIGRLVNEIIEVSENDDIFDTLILLQQDSWHNFKSRLLHWNSVEKSQQFFKELFLKCLSKVSIPDSLIIQVNLCQKHLFSHQLTHKMIKDCSLIYQFST